jgi:hypothetical protein
MKQARVILVACFVLVVCAASLTALPAAPNAPTIPTTDAAFLASLASLAPIAPDTAVVPGIGVPEPSPRSCGAGFCADARRECQTICAPCTGVVTGCVISICDFTCWCQC